MPHPSSSTLRSWIPAERSRRLLGIGVAVIVLLGALYAVSFDALIAAMAAWPLVARATAAALLMAPLAFCMGMPFPLALRGLPQPLVPWAWGINGCASVVGAALAKAGGNKAKAARLLQIDYKTIHLKVKEYGIATQGGADHGQAEGQGQIP